MGRARACGRMTHKARSWADGYALSFESLLSAGPAALTGDQRGPKIQLGKAGAGLLGPPSAHYSLLDEGAAGDSTTAPRELPDARCRRRATRRPRPCRSACCTRSGKANAHQARPARSSKGSDLPCIHGVQMKSARHPAPRQRTGHRLARLAACAARPLCARSGPLPARSATAILVWSLRARSGCCHLGPAAVGCASRALPGCRRCVTRALPGWRPTRCRAAPRPIPRPTAPPQRPGPRPAAGMTRLCTAHPIVAVSAARTANRLSNLRHHVRTHNHRPCRSRRFALTASLRNEPNRLGAGP